MITAAPSEIPIVTGRRPSARTAAGTTHAARAAVETSPTIEIQMRRYGSISPRIARTAAQATTISPIPIDDRMARTRSPRRRPATSAIARPTSWAIPKPSRIGKPGARESPKSCATSSGKTASCRATVSSTTGHACSDGFGDEKNRYRSRKFPGGRVALSMRGGNQRTTRTLAAAARDTVMCDREARAPRSDAGVRRTASHRSTLRRAASAESTSTTGAKATCVWTMAEATNANSGSTPIAPSARRAARNDRSPSGNIGTTGFHSPESWNWVPSHSYTANSVATTSAKMFPRSRRAENVSARTLMKFATKTNRFSAGP